jgi:hypothetical protein
MFDAVHVNFSVKESTKSGNKTVPPEFLLVPCVISYMSFYRRTMHFEIYVVHSTTNALFINLAKSFKFTLKYTIILLLHVSVFSDHHQGVLSVPN